jgi:uncharacterized protein YkwD
LQEIASNGTQRRTRRSQSALLVALVTAIALAAAPGLASARTAKARTAKAPCRDANLRPTSTDLARIDAATACLIDAVRASAHLRPLRVDARLQGVAAGQSSEMVLGDYFGDNTRAGATPLQRIVATRYQVGARAISTAQNIGWATGSDATPAGIVAAWMRSPPHRRIILTGAFRDLGVGAAPTAPAALAEGQPGATYTAEFGARVR